MIRTSLALLLTCCLTVGLASRLPADEKSEDDDGWVTIFDGTSLDGWKISENEQTWTLEDGVLITKGPRSHIFYVGDDEPFVNFELKVDVMTEPGANGGIYFHTRFQEEGWPRFGYEAQVNNTYRPDPKKTGSLYGVVDVTEQHIEDNTWWTQHVIVKGSQITIKLDDEVVVDYTVPADQERSRLRPGSGTFALQAHDPNSVVHYKNIRVRRLE